MTVDSFKYASPLVTRYYKLSSVRADEPIPWCPLPRPLDRCTISLITSGGLYHRGNEAPFDLDREQREPSWGDPSYRTLPIDLDQEQVGVSHWHINSQDILADVNILLPVDRFRELMADREIGRLAPHAYSVMGYQGFPADLSGWRERTGPALIEKMRAEEVDAVFLTTA